MLENAKWIWINNDNNPDEYADFLTSFEASPSSHPTLHIAVDGNFAVYLNGTLCAFGSCADYPFHKFFDSFTLEGCKKGKNELRITVWHIGLQSSTYALDTPGLIFTVTDGDTLLAASSHNTLSRCNINYTNGLSKFITVQLGPSYRYDNTVVDTMPFAPSVEVEKSHALSYRGIRNLELLPRTEAKMTYSNGRTLVDLGREVAGFLELELYSDGDRELLISFGEHLDAAGRVPRRIGSRDFSIGFVAKKGSNRFTGPLRRIAGRYLEIEHDDSVRISYLGLCPIIYPVNENSIRFSNSLHNRIYDTCVHTLRCCMHEHYEDCPWREQALYALDSRNQMLCGYVAFSEYEYPRHNLILLGDGLDDDGLIKLTSPTDIKLPIPFFSLAYVMQVAEYVQCSGDHTILDVLAPTLGTVMNSFTRRIDESGLIPNFPTPAWNFYEWTPGNDGHGDSVNDTDRYDLALNAMYLYVAGIYERLLGENPAPKDMRERIVDRFWDKSVGLFKNGTKDDRISVIGNSLAILAGAADKSVAERLVAKRTDITDVTLSTLCFFYDALLASGLPARDYIITDIEEKYSHMLNAGATTFWETIDGAPAFGGAGSLCHGWSALPIYYLDLLADKKQ
ncbi:MAG: hypothetical protein J6B55_07715 [Clostridia bacterium]|nr:hypothetical protein [Clostridia bacterium]